MSVSYLKQLHFVQHMCISYWKTPDTTRQPIITSLLRMKDECLSRETTAQVQCKQADMNRIGRKSILHFCTIYHHI